jgi:hypothetical protein
VWITGCSAILPSQVASPEANVAKSLNGEKFSATSVSVGGSCGSAFDISFTAHGKATGAYPGTFTASGQWEVYFSTPFSGKKDVSFDETFTIKSAVGMIKGRASSGGDEANCELFERNTAKWHTRNLNPNQRGTLAIPIIEDGHLEETFK